MKTMTLYLDYDARQKLHSLPFEEIAPATEDVYLRLLPQAEGVLKRGDGGGQEELHQHSGYSASAMGGNVCFTESEGWGCGVAAARNAVCGGLWGRDRAVEASGALLFDGW